MTAGRAEAARRRTGKSSPRVSERGSLLRAALRQGHPSRDRWRTGRARPVGPGDGAAVEHRRAARQVLPALRQPQVPLHRPAPSSPSSRGSSRSGPGEPFVLHPGEFVLGSTLETVTLPDDLAARRRGQVVSGAARAADPRDGRLRRPRVLRARDARAVQRRDPADHALPGHEDRPALLLPPQLSRREPYGSAAYGSTTRASAAHGEPFVQELPPHPVW